MDDSYKADPELMRQTFKPMLDNMDLIAECYYKRFVALMKAGFTHEQAMQIILVKGVEL